MALRLTQSADYAIRSMILIASLPEGRTVMRGDVARLENIPSSFTAKILRKLVEAGLLNSTRGVSGGFRLARPASEINLLEVVEAIEGSLAITACADGEDNCEYSFRCAAAKVWTDVQEKISEILANVDLETLVSAPRRITPAKREDDLTVVEGYGAGG